MLIKDEQWNGVPLLHMMDESVRSEENRSAVIFLHGFTSAREHNLHYAFNLAKKGLSVLLPEAHLHGVRAEPLDEVQLSLRFWEIVLTSIEEVGILKEALVERGVQRIGVAGTSMGGITTLGCLKVYDWIDAAAVMMGAPGYVELATAQMHEFERRGFQIPLTDEERTNLLQTLAQFDLTTDRLRLQQRPLYFWHGEQDGVVPYEPTRRFYETIRQDYADAPERLYFHADRQAAHAVSRTGMLEACNWLARYLNA